MPNLLNSLKLPAVILRNLRVLHDPEQLLITLEKIIDVLQILYEALVVRVLRRGRRYIHFYIRCWVIFAIIGLFIVYPLFPKTNSVGDLRFILNHVLINI